MEKRQTGQHEEDYRQKYMRLANSYEELLHLYSVMDQILECSADAIWVSDENGNCLRVNKAYEALIGIPREKLIGRSAQSLVGTAVSDIISMNVLRTGKPHSFEQQFYLTGRTALVTGTPVFDADGRIIMCVCNDRDMNSLEELSDQLQQTRSFVTHYHMEIEKMKELLTARSDIVVKDRRMLELLHTVNKVAKMDSTVLILGETGVGKEEVAKYVHENSQRADEAFVKIDCGAIAPELIESELFGYEKGAFTGADRHGKVGLFELASGGTVFLDEIGELPLSMQTKLLRVLQEQTIKRVGGTAEISVDVRVIAATNRDLAAMVEDKLFRADLYYRINIFPVVVPPLRERQDDILSLADVFLQRLNAKYHTHKHLHFDAVSLIRNYNWPGNIRELKNAIEQAYVVSEDDTIRSECFSFFQKSAALRGEEIPRADMDLPLSEALGRLEYEYILKAYEVHKNVRDAAAALQMSAASFVRKRKVYEAKYGA